MSDFAINGVKTSGTIYELKPGVSIKEAHEKGKNDKIDQVYFEANGKNFVFQGEGLNLNGIQRGQVPAGNLNLAGQKIEVEIDGKKVQATIATSQPDPEIKINGKVIKARIVEIDNETNTKGEAFGKGLSTLGGKIGIGIGAATIGIGAFGGAINFLDVVGNAFRRNPVEPMQAGKLFLAGVAVTAVAIGATGAYGIYQNSKTQANPEQLKPLLGKEAAF